MSATLERKILVLNKNWAPLETISLEEALIKLFKTEDDGVTPKARIIEPESYQTFTWEDWSKLRPLATEESLKGANLHFRIPEIIILSRYDRLPRPKLNFSRSQLYKRDKMTCQYCGAKPGSELLSIDHILPSSKGGLTTWENCALCCVDCNRKKADRTPEQAGMKLLSKPCRPDRSVFKFESGVKPIKSWRAFISESFWNVELENDNVD